MAGGVSGEDGARSFSLGDPDANCTRGNGRNDTEDLDGDGNLSTEDRVYQVRGEAGRQLSLPGQDLPGDGNAVPAVQDPPAEVPSAVNVGGRVTEADWRAVKHLRLTVAGPESQGVSLVRLRLLGSRWVKRGEEGVLAGLAGEIPGESGGRVDVGLGERPLRRGRLSIAPGGPGGVG
jgi:hypothetical protein